MPAPARAGSWASRTFPKTGTGAACCSNSIWRRTRFWACTIASRSVAAGGIMLDQAAIRRRALAIIDAFDVRPANPDLPARALSGGNQQKLIIGREFDVQPRLLLVSQPTRGVDIGAIEFIHRKLVALRDAGCAVLLVSAELEEVVVAVRPFDGDSQGPDRRRSRSEGRHRRRDRLADDPRPLMKLAARAALPADRRPGRLRRRRHHGADRRRQPDSDLRAAARQRPVLA